MAFLASGSLPASAQDAQPWLHLETVRSVLVEPEREGAPAALAELGPDAAPTLWALLSGRAPLADELDRRGARGLARATIAGWPADEVVRRLTEAMPEDTPFAERLLLLEMLSWTGSESAVPALFGVLAGLDPLQLRSRRVYHALERSLEPILAADHHAYTALSELVPTLPRELLPPVVEAVGDLQNAAVVTLLAEIASLGPELESAVLAALGEGGQRLAPGAGRGCIALARRHLVSFDARQRRLAVVALGRLRDSESFFDIVTRLQDDDPVVRRVALSSLQELSGMRRSWSAEQWSSWWETENDWLASSDELGEELARGDAYRAGKAVHEVARHRLFAEQAAALLSHALDHEEARIRALTCSSLGRLEHAAAVPLLLEALHDRDEGVRAAAHAALGELSGVELGPDAEAWDAWWRALA